MKIKDVPEFSPSRELYTLPSTATVREAVELMVEKHIGAIPVVDDDALVGVFTERDVLNRVVYKEVDMASTPLKEVMTMQPKTVTEEADTREVVDMMVLGKYRHMPVVDGDGKLIGFLSQRDFIALNWLQLVQYTTTGDVLD